MLEDRDYMRQPDFREHRISLTVLLLIVNAAVFVTQLIASDSLTYVNLNHTIQGDYFALSLYGLKHFFLWQLITFQFMHVAWWHLIGNSLAIFFFGRVVEQTFGGARFLKIYFLSGVVGGLVQMLLGFLFPNIFGDAVVGASAGASGLVAAFALMYWHERFTLFFYFVPISMRGRTLLWVIIGMAVVGILALDRRIANAAHLGGILTGAIYARFILRRMLFETYNSEPREFAPARVMKKFWKSSSAQINEELSAEEFLQREVDPILEKISAHGIQSLTKRERDILEKARSKMDRR